MKKFVVLFMSAVLLLIFTGCSTDDANANVDGKVEVVTTIAQIGDVVSNVGGDHVDVKSLMGPGTDPHLYKAAHSDVEAMEEADIIFYNGHHLEGNMNEMFSEMRKSKPTIAVAETVPNSELIADPENPDIPDPHVWFDIDLWKYTVEAVRDGLIEIDPDNEKDFTQNAEDYMKELDDLKTYAVEQFEQIPNESKVLVTAHDAFGYFGEAFGFDVMGLQGLSTETEFSLNDVQRIIDVLVNRNIKAVFVESSVSERSINSVIEGAKEQNHEVSIGGELFSDAMGPKDTEEGTYIGMFKHNIDTIVSSLK
ncbi:manganese/zinc/iron transport system substrate-binding protein [Salirhabdus euzebyi]|uniref:Manganese/zinc/iron transport system substrate-binding protein n=1 Tax=Salirhabdus euzebyi TaxID=394506 RepID=A0A841Q151_9BACI|nr:zinc ABC transporter substrate-binding protein [Salirhabdus euzebyi]MBB6451753.1 manganese/zinc/iron transport system substrate-binding protein [Salirhabdus euzebyi]